MKNIFNELKYVILLIIICFVVMGNSGIISRLVLTKIKNEIIPFSDEKYDMFGKELINEVIPANMIKNIDKELTTATISSDNKDMVDVTETTEASVTSDDLVADTEVLTTENISPAVAINDQEGINNIGINYSMEELNNFEFLIGNCYTIDGSTSVTSDDINVEAMLSEDLSIDLNSQDYKVLVYHTHASEAFVDSRPGVTEDTIIGVGDELTRILEEDYGIKTYHDRTIYDMVDGKLDRNYAYTQSGNGIDKILQQYPSIEVVLDIHRDGVRDDVHLMKVIDGKPTAQIMFFNGISRLNDEGELGYLHNPNLNTNLSFSLQMHLKGKAMYGDLMRKIYIGGYCYNLDRKPRASLVEVGAQTNTVEEAKNAMIPLAAILYSVLSGN